MKTPRNLEDLHNLVDESEPETSAAKAKVKDLPPVEHKFVKSVQLSVRMEGEDYALLKQAGAKLGLTNKDIMLEGFHLWIDKNQGRF